MRRLLLVLMLAGAATSPAAHADAFAAPVVAAAGGDQRGKTVYATVHRSMGRGVCQARHADYAAVYPDPAAHDGSGVTWRIADKRRPAKVTVALWRAGTDKLALGTSEPVAVVLSPVRSGSRTTAWLARSADLGFGDLHVDVTVTWPKGTCGADQGKYRYRLLSLPA